ncbi:DUF4346 domain-containing protein [Candidatus Woesearchaeota archaeon]|nr:DUF4346 domain-containing protein [Candidatus Woesearchaeota archaeon]
MEIVTYKKRYEKVTASWDRYKEWKQDKKGYFLIRVNRKNKNIDVGFCKNKNEISIKITGNNPQEIYHTILRKRMVSSMHHSAYLGKELHKAYVALKFGLEYIQDEELDLKRII